MSREVDERIVQMQFDNAQFERNVQKSLKSLEALNESLQMDGAEKGFEKIQDASEELDFTPAMTAVEKLGDKFSALEVMGIAALTRLTNKVIDAGERMVQSLSTDNIRDGWNKYAQKTASVQTIVNATGKSVRKVNGYLDKLMWYADETSYGFTDMTASLGQLTAAGGDIDKVIPMIMGIANATAYAGKGASEFSRVIYNLNQSYSQGYLNLMDWKSVELAGVATAELKQLLIDTAVEMGKLKKGAVSIGNFGSTLSDKWADKEVMETAFGKLAEFTEAVEAAVDAGDYDTASKAIEALADQYDATAVKAFKAAQEAKNFTEAIESTKEAVGSKWLESFEIIFGNYEEAKNFWTDLANELYELFASGGDARNDLLREAFDSGWTQLLGEGLDGVSEVLESGLYSTYRDAGIITDEDIEKAGSFEKALGDALKTGKLSADELEASLRAAGKGYEALAGKSDAELKALGYTRKEIENIQGSFSKFIEKLDSGEISISDFAEKISRASGRETLFQGIIDILEGIESVLNPVKEAFNDILAPSSEGIYTALETFGSFTEKLSLSKDLSDKLYRTFSGVFAVLKMGLDILGGIGSTLATVFAKILPIGGSFLEITANIGDYFVELEKASGITATFETALDGIGSVLGVVSEAIQTAIGWIAELGAKTSIVFDPIKTIGGWIESFVDFITPKLKTLAGAMNDIFEQLGSGIESSFGSLNQNVLWGFANAGLITGILSGIKGFISGFKDVAESVSDAVGGMKKAIESISELLDKLGEAVSAWKTNKNAETLKTIAISIGIMAGSLVVLSLVDPERLAASSVAMIAVCIELMSTFAAFGALAKSAKGNAKALGSLLTISASILILSNALKQIGEIESDKLLGAVVSLGAVMAELVAVQVALSKFAKDGAKHSASLIAMAVAVRILASSVVVFANLEWNEIGKGLVGVAGLLAEVAAFAVVSKYSGLNVGTATAILLLSVALSVLAKSVVTLGEVPAEKLQNGILAIGALLAEIALFDILASLSKNVLSTAAALTILSGGLLVMTQVIGNLSGYSGEELGAALVTIAIALVEMGLALTLVRGSIGNAASFLILAAALNLLVIPISAFGSMSLESIGKGLLAIGGALGAMAVTVGALSLAGPVVIGVALALSLLAASLAALITATAASEFISNLSAGLASLQTIQLEAFVNTLMTIGMAVGYFVAGLITGLGKAIGSVATAIAEIIVAVCDAIIAAVPKIGETIVVLITALCDVLIECLPKIEDTLESLIFSLCNVIVACTPKILETIDSVLGTIFSYIGSKLGSLGGWISGKIQSAFKDEHGVEAGSYVAKGYAKGIKSGASDVENATTELAEKQDAAYRSYWDIHSPSKRAKKDAGYIVAGLNEGIEEGTSSAEKTMKTLASDMDGALRDELGIHSNADAGIEDGEFYVGGIQEGVENSSEGLYGVMENFGANIRKSFRKGLGVSGSEQTSYRSSEEIKKDLENMVLSAEARSALEEELAAALAYESFTTLSNPNSSETGSGTTGTTSTSTKTLADQIKEEYKTKLEANKVLSETAQQEYELWLAENQYSAATDELLAKKAEAAATDITNQTARVALAQEKYDKMTRQLGANKDETKEAYLDLLKEQTTLAELKAEQYIDIFEQVASRYDTDLDTLEKEYGLWTAQNEKSATKTDKIRRETEYLTEELAIKQKQLNNTESQYRTLADKVGEDDQRTREAYAEYLDAQTEYTELQTEVARQQLAEIEASLEAIATEQSMRQSRYDLLATAFDDGSLASREDDYKAAVEEYGEDSPEARKAQWQGTTSSILSVVSALESMSYQMQQVEAYQKELDSGLLTVEEAEEMEAAILKAQTSFVSYAGTLADALDLEDTGKQVTLKVAYAIEKNWDTLSAGMRGAWAKVSEEAPEFAAGFAKAFGTAFSEEGVAIGTEVINTINSAMQGDWQNALASGFVAALDFAGTDLGQNLLQNGTTMLAQAGVDLGMGLLNAGEGLTALLGAGSGLTGLLGGVVGLLPEILPIVGVVAAVGAGIAGVIALVKKWKNANEETAETAIDYPTEYAKSIEEGSSLIEEAVKGMTDTAMDIASAAALTIDTALDMDEEYTPCITPVVDLTNVWDGAAQTQDAFGSMTLDTGTSTRMASGIGSRAEIQNGAAAQSNAELLNAINGLGTHMDSVAENIKGMSVTVDGKKAIGYIDTELGSRTRRNTR